MDQNGSKWVFNPFGQLQRLDAFTIKFPKSGTPQNLSQYAQPILFMRGPNCIVKIQNKGYFCWIHPVIRVAFELPRQNHCSKKWKWVFLPFDYLAGGILYREKGCLVTASLYTGKQWIGVGTVWPGPAWWAFFVESPFWLFHTRNQINMNHPSIAVKNSSFQKARLTQSR